MPFIFPIAIVTSCPAAPLTPGGLATSPVMYFGVLHGKQHVTLVWRLATSTLEQSNTPLNVPYTYSLCFHKNKYVNTRLNEWTNRPSRYLAYRRVPSPSLVLLGVSGDDSSGLPMLCSVVRFATMPIGRRLCKTCRSAAAASGDGVRCV